MAISVRTPGSQQVSWSLIFCQKPNICTFRAFLAIRAFNCHNCLKKLSLFRWPLKASDRFVSRKTKTSQRVCLNYLKFKHN